jgi:hypothetical protein
MQEEIESTKQCLNICTEVSSHIARIRPQVFKNVSTPPDTIADSIVTHVGPILADFSTDRTLQSCDTALKSQIKQLQKHLQNVSDQLHKLQSDSERADFEQESERQRIQDEFDSTKESLALCVEASGRASPTRLNIFEEVSIDEDGNQYIVSTIGDLISAKKIRAGARSLQCMGQLSDQSFQMMLTHSTPHTASGEASDTTMRPGRGFEHRYGTGFTLDRQKSAVSGADKG